MPTSIRNIMNATMQPLTSYGMHDFAHYTDFSEEKAIHLENAADLLEEDFNNLEPEIEAFLPTNMISYGTLISDLNADAKLFFPPYFRYRKYRSMAQHHEIEEFKEKAAKIAAISKGNELIKSEVLEKLEQAQIKIENEEMKVKEINDNQKKTQQRKRKISAEKVDHKTPVDIVTDNNIITKEEIKEEITGNSTKKIDSNVKPFAYNKYADYKKFFNQSNKEHKQKQPKMKFKKYKK